MGWPSLLAMARSSGERYLCWEYMAIVCLQVRCDTPLSCLMERNTHLHYSGSCKRMDNIDKTIQAHFDDRKLSRDT